MDYTTLQSLLKIQRSQSHEEKQEHRKPNKSIKETRDPASTLLKPGGTPLM